MPSVLTASAIRVVAELALSSRGKALAGNVAAALREIAMDAGTQLATGTPTGQIPAEQERKYNYEIVKGGRYAKAADAYAA